MIGVVVSVVLSAVFLLIIVVCLFLLWATSSDQRTERAIRWIEHHRVTPVGATTRQDDQEHTCTHTEEEDQ